MTETLLDVENLSVCYDGVQVLEKVSFSLQKGQILGIVGESGSGKSTLIKAVMGILDGGIITEGTIFFKGKDLAELTEKEYRRMRGPEMGMVFQDCRAALCPIRKLKDQIYESMAEHQKISRKKVYEQAAELMDKIGLTDYKRVLESYPFELSGGMNQRVGICMAMMQHPDLLLADEPTSALDMTVQKQVVEEFLLMRREYGTAMILVTHNIGVAEKMSDQILVLKNGKQMDYGETSQVLKSSQNPYTRKLMDSVLHLKRCREEYK